MTTVLVAEAEVLKEIMIETTIEGGEGEVAVEAGVDQ